MKTIVHTKQKKSTFDIIYRTKQNFVKKRIQGQILFDLSKAFDKINREKLWRILYEKGLPIKTIQQIIIGRSGNSLFGKHNGVLGAKVDNKGVFQGSPISALLYIIYAGNLMMEYKNEINNNFNKDNKQTVRNTDIENKWTEYMFNKNHDNPNSKESAKWTKPDPSQTITIKNDNILFADDTAINYNDTNDI